MTDKRLNKTEDFPGVAGIPAKRITEACIVTTFAV
jgi:hypothetical protein